MVDFSLSEEQLGYVKWVREFADAYVRPAAPAFDQLGDPDERIPWSIIERAHAEGLLRFGLPAAYGGTPIDELTFCLLLEELGAADIGVASIVAQYWNVTHVIHRLGTDYHRDRFIRAYVDNPRALYALAMTEPSSGIDSQLPYDVPEAGPMLSATPDGDEIVLNGIKRNIAIGNVADVIVVWARTDKSVGLTKGMTMFVVPKESPGFSVAHTYDLTGHRLAPITEIRFDDCRIPRENQLTEWNAAYSEMARQTIGRHWVGARFLGVGREALEVAIERTKTRVQGCKPIIEHQIVARQIGEMAMTIEAARNVIWKAAWGADNPDKADPVVMRMARVIGSEAAMKVALDAVRLFGASGVRVDVGVEKLLRDAASGLAPAPQDVSFMVAGQSIAGIR